MRFANGGNLQANRADGTVENVLWPRWTDNNTYLNYGGGGYFYIRDNASNLRMIFDPEGTGFTTWVQARGINGYDLRLGGSRYASRAWISATPNLHLDSPDGWDIYLNHYSNRAVNIGAIDQSTHKLAVAGSGWFNGSVRLTGEVVAENQWGVILGGANLASCRLRAGEIYGDAGLHSVDSPHMRFDVNAGYSTRFSAAGTVHATFVRGGNTGGLLLEEGGWFRNAQEATGLYNQICGRHLYVGWDGSNHGWHITGQRADGTFSGETYICLRRTHQGTMGGWLFASTEGFGLVHSGRGWAVRTWNGGTMLYGDVQVESHLNLTDGNLSHLGTSKRIYFGETSNAYAIFKSNSWPSSGGGYSRLVINYHTGIVMGAQQQYGGIQFFGTELGAGGAKLFSIGEGDADVRVANTLYSAGVRASDRMNAVNGYSVNDSSRYFDNGLTFGLGGGWFMQDTAWMRTFNEKSVWLGGGWYGTNGGITLGRGGAYDPAYRLDCQGRIRGTSQSQAAGFSSAAIEVREYNFTGWTGDGNWYNAPRISFHWGGRVASQIAMASDGRIHILNNPGNANEDLQARNYFNDQGHRMAASLAGQGSPTMTANEGTLYVEY